jgi:hypothetical protein
VPNINVLIAAVRSLDKRARRLLIEPQYHHPRDAQMIHRVVNLRVLVTLPDRLRAASTFRSATLLGFSGSSSIPGRASSRVLLAQNSTGKEFSAPHMHGLFCGTSKSRIDGRLSGLAPILPPHGSSP